MEWSAATGWPAGCAYYAEAHRSVRRPLVDTRTAPDEPAKPRCRARSGSVASACVEARRTLWFVFALVMGCGASEGVDPPSTQGRPTGPPEPPAPILAPAVLSAVCAAAPCGGDRPTVSIYRDSTGSVRRLYRMYGSCFHSPGLYFEPDGTLADTIPEQPVTVGSPEADALRVRHERQLGGLRETDILRCSDGLRVGPR